MQYCDVNHFKAEITFELPSGGKEGKVVSFNPPVEVLVGVNGWVNYLYLYTNESGNQQWRHVYTFADGHLFHAPSYDNGIPLQGRNYTYMVRTVAYGQNGEQILGGLFKILPATLTFFQEATPILDNQQLIIPARETFSWYNNNYNNYGKSKIDNALIISDTNGLVYFGNYPQGFAPKYEVRCIGCPNGEVAISRDGGEDFICIDKNRVISESKNIGSRINSLMSYLQK